MRCVLVHGCPDTEERSVEPTYDEHWMPRIKQELASRHIAVDAPRMPRPWRPDYAAFKEEFEKAGITEDTILIGHSCGCAFLVRWLGDTKRPVRKLILVAPWKIPSGDRARQAFYSYQIDRTIRARVGEIVIFTSDDEEEDGKRSAHIFHDALGGRVIELPSHGHYTFGDMGTNEFPELLDEILKSNL